MNAGVNTKSGIEDAVALAGGQAVLARQLGVTIQALGPWVKRGWVPTQRALQIESMYGVPRVRLLKPELAALLPDAATN